MRTIIAGSRTATFLHVRAAVDACPFKDQITRVISGTARGADTYGEHIAAAEGWGVDCMPADWDRYGRRAGYIRNEEMAQVAKALIAVWDGESKGTRHMINLAEQYGLRVFVYEWRALPEWDAALEREESEPSK